MILLSDEQRSQTRRLILVTGIVTTLIVWTSLADPINVPKMLALTILSAWVLGTVVVVLISGKRIKMPLGQWAVVVFALGLLVAALSTDVKYIAFFGATHRNDGAFSYLALATLCFASMMAFNSSNIHLVRNVLAGVGLVLTGYGVLQTRGHDPFHWVLLYGPVVGTLGNPDFMSGFLGVASIATLWVIVARGKTIFRVSAIVLLLCEIFIVKRSGSIQGLVAFGVGFVILLVAKLWQIKRAFGIMAVVVASVGSILVILGFLNQGPLAARIFRSTLRNRLDYWHGAISMFTAHPFAGVGIDRFGESYRQYAPQVQIVQGQTTDNPHNVFLELLATGGAVLILPYLFLLGVIFWTAVRAIKTSRGETQIGLAALFSVWFGFLLVSFISIDMLGVAVWFWISGGALYGAAHHSLAKMEEKSVGKKKLSKSTKSVTSNNSNTFAPIVSLVFAIVALIIMLPTWRSSAMLLDLQRYDGGLSQTQFADELRQIASIEPSNIQTLNSLSNTALHFSQMDLALSFTKIVNEKDPRSFYGNDLSAVSYETTKRYQQAIPYRIRLTELDPWNTANMLQLVKDYVQVKDLVSARAIVAKISALQPGGSDAMAASALLKG